MQRFHLNLFILVIMFVFLHVLMSMAVIILGWSLTLSTSAVCCLHFQVILSSATKTRKPINYFYLFSLLLQHFKAKLSSFS